MAGGGLRLGARLGVFARRSRGLRLLARRALSPYRHARPARTALQLLVAVSLADWMSRFTFSAAAVAAARACSVRATTLSCASFFAAARACCVFGSHHKAGRPRVPTARCAPPRHRCRKGNRRAEKRPNPPRSHLRQQSFVLAQERSGQQRRPCDSPQCPRQRSFYGLIRKKLARSGPSSSGVFNGNRFPQQKVFQDELPFAGNEWSTANTACYFESDGLRPRFGFDDLVKRVAAWAAEKRRCVGTRHNDAAATDRANSNRSRDCYTRRSASGGLEALATSTLPRSRRAAAKAAQPRRPARHTRQQAH